MSYDDRCMTTSSSRARLSPRVIVKRSSAGLGLFADASFKRGEQIVEYTGPRLTNAQADVKGGRYLMAISSRKTIDGSGRDNIARYANHSCAPNCFAQSDRGRVFLIARRSIKPGEEITYNYGKEYTGHFFASGGCKCATCFEERL
jgi:uncharacterized protein